MIASLYIFFGCQNHQNDKHVQTVSLEGTGEVSIAIFEVILNDNKELEYSYVGDITSKKSLKLLKGNYVATNECSAYPFSLNKNSFNIKIDTVNLQYHESILENKPVFTEIVCHNPINEKTTILSGIEKIFLLPGKHQITIGGKNFNFHGNTDKIENFDIDLYPLNLISNIQNDQTNYFIEPVSQNSQNVENNLVTNIVNRTIWLPLGRYKIEINGTKQDIEIQSNQETRIDLGSIRILAPQSFFASDSARVSNSPAFVYLNTHTLLKLNEIYSILPGQYTINLNNSKMEKGIFVQPGEMIKVQTYGAKISPPNCIESDSNSCKFTSKIMIYEQGIPEAKLTVNLGDEFLVFEGEYQYGVGGIDDLLKKLKTSSTSVVSEQIGEITLNWKLKLSDKNFETHKIQIESVCCNLFGKSKDINLYKPRKLLLPIGDYRIISAIRQSKGGLVKQSHSISVTSESSNEIEIPIYAQSDQNFHIFYENDNENSNEPTELIPIAP